MPLKLFGVVNSDKVEDAAVDVLRTGQIAAGHWVEDFRRAFGEVIENDLVVTTNDMSNAMQIALRLADVAPGDEVVAPPFSCMSSNAPVGTSGAKIVWCDMDAVTATTSVDNVRAALSDRTKAVVIYHLAGYPSPARDIAQLCRARGIALIEDCNNAIGATVDGRPVGSFGDFAVFSFYPNRQINAIDGGAVSCRREDDYRRATLLRRYGIDSPRFRSADGEIEPTLDISELGWAATMSNLHSAAAFVQLGERKERLFRTRRNADLLSRALSGICGVQVVDPIPNAAAAYWAFLVLSDRRDAALAALKREDIEASKIHQRNDVYSAFRSERLTLPGVDVFSAKMLGLPCGWWLSENDVHELADKARRIFERLA